MSEVPYTQNPDGSFGETAGDISNLSGQSLIESQSPELIKWQLSNNDLLLELELRIMGLKWSSKKGKYLRASDPLMNNKGLKDLTTLLASLSDKGIILSNYTEDDIHKIMRDLMDTVIMLLASNYQDYEINKYHLSAIRVLFENTAYASLRRAWQGKTADGMNKSFEHKELVSVNPSQKKGWFS